MPVLLRPRSALKRPAHAQPPQAPLRALARAARLAAALLLRGTWLLLMFALVGWLWFSQGGSGDAPQHRLAAVSLQLMPGQSVLLGRHQLAAPAADLQHLRVWRDLSGAWWFSNVSATRAVAWQQGRNEGQLRQVVLQPAQTLWIAGRRWVLRDGDGVLTLGTEPPTGPAATWHYDGARLWPSTPAEARTDCTDQPLTSRLRQRWNASAPRPLAWPTPLHWGGTRACGNRLPEPALAPGSLSVVRTAAGWQLEASAAASKRVCLADLVAQACPRGASLFEQAMPLADGLRITIGRTTLLAQFGQAQDPLRLVPVHRAGWVAPDAEPPQPELVTDPQANQAAQAHAPLAWERQTADPWRWPPQWPWYGVLAGGLAAAVAIAAWLHLRHGTAQTSALGLAGALVLAVVSLALLRLGQEIGPALALCWALLAVLAVALLPGRTGWSWASHAGLATMLTMGLAAQWQLGRQGLDTGAWQYLHKTAALGAFGLYALQVLAWWLRARARAADRAWLPGAMAWEVLLFGLGLAAMAGLALQALIGSEEGLLGIVQPVELAKLALVVLGAHALAVRLEWAGTGGWRRWGLWWRLLAPMGLFIALGATALLLLQDYSPVLLLALWLVGVIWAWALAAGSWGAALLGVLAASAGVGVWAWLQLGDGSAWMEAHGFYGDRFAVWLDLLRHPHSGEQVLRAIRLAVQGGWWGDGLAPAWRVPAVQDDMAPAFFTGRFGLAAALLLLAVQFGYLGSLLMLGWQALCAVQPGDYRRRWGLRLVFFAAWGAAALFAGHLLLSWGTNTGWLPVMGQPMPLVSAGGSVIVLLLVPLHLLWLLQPELSARPRQKQQ